ncbi:MAG: tRNA pseudouridine(38-40) synthase TruA [Blastocatellia bacterium]|nr:tRNA pseudouridine(38-40) synthase TruA [Blastocatellia bacterium]MBL8195021.1 tRNA pseudouridine(38-40) synthase TruA [Blastocatellia bacterium]MBN8724629.1 tRNA pseudouridine(38-40) synthase TruA [Acidobacteriota bacterium]
MRNIKLTLQYDGTNYCGWQIQPNGTTIQGILTEILRRITSEKIILHGAGRTDAGVHAFGQVASFLTEKQIACDKLKRAINGNLPLDIRVSSVEEVAQDFHARFSAKGKSYRYQVGIGEIVSPFKYRYFYHYPYKLNLLNLQIAASNLIGTHNFAAFATAPETHSCIRTITSIEIEEKEDKLIFQVSGNGFLRYMVRTIVGTLLEVGRGKLEVEKIIKILQSQDRSQAGPTAPACGLTLLKVDY